MRVLIACEYSGIVRDAFISKGHYAMSCDLLPTESPGPHYQGDVFDIINDGWDMMIAFPPCTHLCVSGAAHFEKKRKDGRQKQGIDFFLSICSANINKIAIENPVGIMSSIYRKPDQIINPYYFGDNVSKKTCLWLTNLKPLIHIKEDDLFDKKTHVEGSRYITLSSGRRLPEWHYNTFGDGKKRSKFFPSIAKAMADQWG